MSVEVKFYKEADGSVPFTRWVPTLEKRVQAKIYRSVAALEDIGHELLEHRSFVAHLRDDIYELRVRFGSVHYRVLFFFHGRTAAILSHGCTKEDVVPPKEIDLAVSRRAKFMKNPQQHSSSGE